MPENTEVKVRTVNVEQTRYDALIADKTRLRVIEKYVQSSEYIDKEILKCLMEV